MRYRLAVRRRGLHRPILSSWTCFRVPLRSSRWIWPDEPRESRSSKLDERFLSGVNSKMSGGCCCFSVICIRRSPDPGNSLFSSRLTNAAAADFTNRVGSVEQGYAAMPSWRLCGSPAPSFRLNCVGLLPLWSVSPTSRPVRQVWPSIWWPSFRPTRQTSSRKWTRGLVWLRRL